MKVNQLYALADLLEQGFDTATAWQIKERLKWTRESKTLQAARWHITRFVAHAKEMIVSTMLRYFSPGLHLY